jgi:hypothetical protein
LWQLVFVVVVMLLGEPEELLVLVQFMPLRSGVEDGGDDEDEEVFAYLPWWVSLSQASRSA